MAGGHTSAGVRSALVYGWKHQNGGPFRCQTRHQMRQPPLPVQRVHPDGGAAEDRGNPSGDALKYLRQPPAGKNKTVIFGNNSIICLPVGQVLCYNVINKR